MKTVRLMGLFNVQIEKVAGGAIKAVFHSESHEEARRLESPFIHWIPADSGIPCEVVMPDAMIAKGIAEDGCRGLNANDIVQFERFGFVRVDSVDSKLKALFTHR